MTLQSEILLLERTLWREHQDEMRRMEEAMDEQATLCERTEGP